MTRIAREARARPATRRARPATLPATGCDTTDLGVVRAAYARSLSLGVHLVHPTQFWTQCIVFDSLFGTLFMNTVHEHCSRGFKKKTFKNEIFKNKFFVVKNDLM